MRGLGCSGTIDRMTATTTHEIADGVYRFSTCIPEVAPGGFTFNQFLIDGDEPLLFHCGPRGLFAAVSEAVARVIPLDRLRWITFGHVEADECGAMNQWLAASPSAQVTFNPLGCDVSLNDMADRRPRVLTDHDVLDIGGHRLRVISTPHVPHGWEAQVLYDETTSTLFCGDLFGQTGNPPALVHDADIVGAALEAEGMFRATCLTAATAPTISGLTELAPRTLALMHGPSYAGDCVAALGALADGYASLFETSQEGVVVR
jgi:flavorubredoxin